MALGAPPSGLVLEWCLGLCSVRLVGCVVGVGRGRGLYCVAVRRVLRQEGSRVATAERGRESGLV
jgi:hypothetical protein